MAQLHRSVVTLRILGDDLDPAEISALLGGTPTASRRKGDVFKHRTAKFGLWRLSASDREPENLDAQIEEILDKLSPSLDVWRSIAARYKIDLFCGLFMHESNEGLYISPASLAALGQRGILLGLDIYSPTIEELQAQQALYQQ